MPAPARLLFACTFLFLAARTPLYAQEQRPPRSEDFAAEYSLIEHLIGTIVSVIESATLQERDAEIGEELTAMARRLHGLAPAFHPDAQADASQASPGTAGDLERLERLLREQRDSVRDLRARLLLEEAYDLAAELAPIEDGLVEAAALATRLADRDAPLSRAAEPKRLAPDTYGEEDRPEAQADTAAERIGRTYSEAVLETREAAKALGEARKATRDAEKARARHRPCCTLRGPTDAGVFVGELPERWPYLETALYRTIPALRYNRVEGFVLGIGGRPLTWHDDHTALYGQVGYAFALDRWRYEIGAETRLVPDRAYGLKVGAAYRRNTTTNDLWKASWLENTLAAFLFEEDFFDYYEVEGWSLYAVQQLTPYVQLSGGFRSEVHHSLERHTSWSLFGGDGFRPNPLVDEGRMYSFVFALEGGRVAAFDDLPRGAAFRAEAELGHGLGGDFTFNRYIADGRAYLPVTYHSTLALRLRGGLAVGEVPLQKRFSLGGVGSVRAYPINLFEGTRMLLANAEYIVEDVHPVEDLQFFGFFDAGWVSDAGSDLFDVDGVFPAAGFGVGLDDRLLRLELAWPLRDLGFGRDPVLWLRLTPTF